MSQFELVLGNGEFVDVRKARISECLSKPFRIEVEAVSTNEDIDFEAVIGAPAAFTLVNGAAFALVPKRTWVGVCTLCEQTRVESTGLSTYRLVIESQLWLLSQRQNHRVFQHLSAVDIVSAILSEWNVEHELQIDTAEHVPLELRMQYGETDLTFITRMLEEVGASYLLVSSGQGMKMIITDSPHARDKRSAPLSFIDQIAQAQAAQVEYASALCFRREARPGKIVLRDFDFRNPRFNLEASASSASDTTEETLEVYRFVPGGFLVEGHEGGETPAADDRGVARHHQPAGAAIATRMLEAEQAHRRSVTFQTNAYDVAPGVVFSLLNHPKSELAPDSWILATELTIVAEVNQEWEARVTGILADTPYRPPLATPKPTISGVQSAIVVGPSDDAVHTDEFGRVRVQFIWDRDANYSELSSCWIRVSQAWAGSGYGHIVLPRVGHEVLVGFVDGNPDLPIVTGRVFNGAQQPPYKLPGSRLVSAWKTSSNSNIIVFDDTPGEEGFYTQAEKDRVGIVKKDETYMTGGKRTLAVKKDYKSYVGGAQSHFACKEYKILAGKDVKTTGLMKWAGKAGLEASLKSGKDIKIGVQPIVPFVQTLIDVLQAKAKLKKALPHGPPDLSAVLPDFTKGGITVIQGAAAQPKKLTMPQVKAGMEDVINVLGALLKNTPTAELDALFDQYGIEGALAQLLAQKAHTLPKKLQHLGTAEAMLAHLQGLLGAVVVGGSSGKKAAAKKYSKKKKKKKEETSNAIDILQAVAQVILDKIVPKTKIELEHQKITIATEKAKIELDDDSIKVKADKDIEIKAGGKVKIEGKCVKIKPSPCKCK